MPARNNQPPQPVAAEPPRVLFSWLGLADCGRALSGLQASAKLTKAEADAILHPARYEGLSAKDLEEGKLEVLLSQHSFAEVHILTELGDAAAEAFQAWMSSRGHDVTVHVVAVANPYDYEEVYRQAAGELQRHEQQAGSSPRRLAFFLNPGTRAMSAVWVLLSRTSFSADLFQLTGDDALPQQVRFPFRIGGLDFIPEIEARRAQALAGLAATAAGQDLPAIDGDSEAIYKVKRLILKYAPTPFDVLIHGASGAGKEVVATRLVEASSRRPPSKPFVKVNCAAIPEDLLESELFGHVKGAFTGAVANKSGKFKDADDGTLFLDEIGECSPSMQAKLLRVLQPDDLSSPTVRRITPIGAGSDTEETVDVRIIAATNRDLKAMVDQGTFRADLYYRLTTLVIRLPSLEERREDIRVLAKQVVNKANAAMAAMSSNTLAKKTLTEAACDFLTQIAWPGNVRQLNSVLARAVVSSAGDLIDESDIRDALAEDPFYSPIAQSLFGRKLGGTFDLPTLLEECINDLRRHYIPRAIEEARGNRSAAARLLGFGESSGMRYHEQQAGLLGKSAEPNNGE